MATGCIARSVVRQTVGRWSGNRSAARLSVHSLHQTSHALSSHWCSFGSVASTPSRPGWATAAPQQTVPKASASQAASDADDMLLDMELDISIKGMMCDGCTSRVTETLQKAQGVTNVQVSLEKGMATVEIRSPSQLEAFNMLPKLVDSIKALGFEAEPHIDGL